MLVKGIDISEWQGLLTLDDFIEIKNQDFNFIIIRCGYTSYSKDKGMFIDRYFENNYRLAKEVGLNVGTYYYSCAISKQEAIEESNFVLNLIKNKQFEYPIIFDTEDNHDIYDSTNSSISQYSIGKNKLTEIVKTFCDLLEKNNYYVSIYASSYWFNKRLNLNDLIKYDKWVAQWSNTRNKSIKHGIWQYSSTGRLNGIKGNVDLDNSYLDYPNIIKDNGLNGFKQINKYKLQINYLCNDKKIKKTDLYEFDNDEKYNLSVPDIDGFTKTMNEISGIIKQDTVVNVLYIKNTVEKDEIHEQVIKSKDNIIAIILKFFLSLFKRIFKKKRI